MRIPFISTSLLFLGFIVLYSCGNGVVTQVVSDPQYLQPQITLVRKMDNTRVLLKT